MAKQADLKKISITAMFCALAFLMTFIFRFKVAFLTFDFKDAIIAMASLIYGPLYGVLSAAVVTFLEFLSVSDTGIYGLIMNFLSSATFSFICGIIYKYRRTCGGAIMSVSFAALGATAVMLIANIFITPFYMMDVEFMDVIAMLPTLILPFNLCKTVINAALTMLIYKPVIGALRRVGVVSSAGQTRYNIKSIAIAAVSTIIIIITVLFIILHLNGVFEVF